MASYRTQVIFDMASEARAFAAGVACGKLKGIDVGIAGNPKVVNVAINESEIELFERELTWHIMSRYDFANVDDKLRELDCHEDGGEKCERWTHRPTQRAAVRQPYMTGQQWERRKCEFVRAILMQQLDNWRG